jgi:hypothetical protein
MRKVATLLSALCVMILLPGCAVYVRHGQDKAHAQAIEKHFGLQNYSLTPDLEDKILALDPEHVTAEDITNVLSHAPAPQIINIHGGIYPVQYEMISLSKFFIGMGYPETSIRNSGDGTWTYSCYEDSDKIAGVIAWYYEKQGMRPMMIGHSQGGMQAVKVLYRFTGHFSKTLQVWSPLTWKNEKRHEIIDPLTGKPRPVASLQLSYVAATGSGGLTRLLPNQWEMFLKLHTIPDSAVEFTGFYKGMDLLGGDFLGFGPLNQFHANGTAKVRNVRLPLWESHVTMPSTEHLLKSRQIMDWINNYTPAKNPNEETNFDSNSSHILFAADVWYSVKKHWVLELQRLVRAKRGVLHDN